MTCHILHVTYNIRHVTCHVSCFHVSAQNWVFVIMSHVACHMSYDKYWLHMSLTLQYKWMKTRDLLIHKMLCTLCYSLKDKNKNVLKQHKMPLNGKNNTIVITVQLGTWRVCVCYCVCDCCTNDATVLPKVIPVLYCLAKNYEFYP